MSAALEADRQRLLELLTRQSFEEREVVLSSGKRSNFYIDCKRTMLTAEGHYLVGRLLFAAIREHLPEAVAAGGLTLGADPLASAVSFTSHLACQPLPAFIVRKEAKAHGMGRRVEGPDVAGRRVIAVEDTSTTGGSALTAVEGVRRAGGDVRAVAVIVDRSTGSKERIEAEAGVPYLFAFGKDELGLA